MKHSDNQEYKHGNYKLYKSKLFPQNIIFILAELAKYLSPVNQQKWLILNLPWQGSLDLCKENRWVRKSQFGAVGNFWKPKSIWAHSHNVSCFHMLLLDAQCLGEWRSSEGLIPRLPAPLTLHRTHSMDILIRLDSELHIFPFGGSQDLTWPVSASVFSPLKWTQFNLFHLHHDIVIKSYQDSTCEAHCIMKSL